MSSPSSHPPALGAMHRFEFIALMAGMMSLTALAIDSMLPALDRIGDSLGVTNANHRQYIVSAFLLGFGVAQLIYGPLSDWLGRRKPVIFGISIYVFAALAAMVAPNFETMLAMRALQGLGAAALRVITVSIVRDVYGGRRMAEAMSLIMMVFMIVPVIAPGTGQIIMLFGNWHWIFAFMATGAAVVGVWMYVRLPETLPVEQRRPFNPKTIAAGFRIVLTNRLALCYTLATTFIFGALFGFINSAQQIYIDIYELGDWFAAAFAAVAIFMAAASFINSRLVGRFGMRKLSHGSLLGFIAINLVWLIAHFVGPQPMPFLMFLTLFALSMFQFGWIGANFNSLAMEPLGHVAGTASSVLGFMSTVGGALIGAIIGQSFNGTSVPMVAGFFVVSIIGLVFVLIAERGKLFQPHNPAV
ncbi:DHA1 family bicyclomycin/chloramphenicol resistance-like MFS transporter [Rhizobium halophytocola]|uniref:Bcr/CflA family efflux transporter n=2 Tax=Rhizobium halophytocola TaxID=735519 RepID=A0ABS4DZC1_9HYPH|nr:DHA1 family bicyclomycin/chloramphenicol resistance-like MFS transporter [Rhizobium halophytocola]